MGHIFFDKSEIHQCFLFLITLVFCGLCPSPVKAQSPQKESVVVTPPSISSKTSMMDEAKSIAAISEENNIFFSTGSTAVDETGKAKLQQHADRLIKNSKIFVTLVGHTDGQGSPSYNLAIAEERLMAVSKLLRSFGVPPRQIRRNRSGSVKIPSACQTTECRQQMRRVELVFSP